MELTRLVGLPWPRAENPYIAELVGETKRLIQDHPAVCDGFLKRFDNLSHLSFVSSHVYPTASYDRLIACHSAVFLFWVLDEELEADGTIEKAPLAFQQKINSYLSVLRHGSLPSDPAPIHKFLLEVRGQLAAYVMDSWFQLFCRSLEDYVFKGVTQTTRNRLRNTILEIEIYLTQRTYDVCVFPYIDIIEIAKNIEIPNEVHQNPIIQNLKLACVQNAAFLNDIVSYQRESQKRDPNNLVSVLMHKRALSFVEAVIDAIHITESTIEDFLRLERAVPQWGQEVNVAVKAYTDGMKELMRGCYDFYIESGFYSHEDSPFIELRT